MSRAALPAMLARSAVSRLESGLGLLSCMTISLLVPTACLLGVIDRRQGRWDASRWGAVAALAGSGLVEGYCILLALRSFGRRRAPGVPFAPAVAMKQARLPLPLRPVAAAWWLAHFAVGAGLAFGVTFAELALSRPTSGQWAVVALASAGSFGLSYAANVYLLLAVTALTANERPLRAVWRLRVVIDAAIVFAAVGASFLFKWSS